MKGVHLFKIQGLSGGDITSICEEIVPEHVEDKILKRF